MKVLVIGINGQLGWELMRRGRAAGLELVGVGRSELDIADPQQVRRVFDSAHPDVVVNGAAFTDVDGAETRQSASFAANAQGPAYLAEACAPKRVPLIHFSTDYVFDGTSNTPYTESDTPSPINVYGQSKAEGEAAVRQRLQEHIILRTAWLYGVHGRNFLNTMLRLGGDRRQLQVVADQYGSPTTAADLADAVLTIVAKWRAEEPVDWGTYHYCGEGVTTWHEFARTIFTFAGEHRDFVVEQIDPITSAEYRAAAKRPPFSSLDCSRIENTFGIATRPWQQRLYQTIERIYTGRPDHDHAA